MNDSTMADLIKKYAPVLYFHPQEAYMPTSVDTYLAHCALVTPANVSQPHTTSVNLDDLANAGADAYLQPFGNDLDTVRKGDLKNAHVYVNVVGSAAPALYEIQYWFFYAFNGPTTLRFDGTLGLSTDNEAPPLGQHDSDWEHITVRVDSTGAIVAVYFAQHSSGQWYPPASSSTTNDGFHTLANTSQVLVYVAKNTHACYPWPGDFAVPGSELDYTVLTFSLRDITPASSSQATLWNAALSNVLQTVNINAPGLTAVSTPPKWVLYTGKWAPDESQGLTVAETTTVILQAIASVPWLVALLVPLSIGGVLASTVIATTVLSIVKIWDETGPGSPPWNKGLPNLTGKVVIYSWNCLQHNASMVISVDANHGLVLTEFVLGGVPQPEQQWLCVPNTSPDAPAGSFTLVNWSIRTAPTPPAKDGAQIMLGTTTLPSQDASYAWILLPESKDGVELWAIRSSVRGNVMDASHGGCGDSTKVIYHSWNQGDNQRWRLNPVQM
ncbi:MAG TPA: Vps62-related protein [Roseiflexaceae bacterium]|nr:Vps62-related protein [Roseiflexaceae bacterium]